MNQSPFSQATSRLGPGLKGVLGVIAVVGLLEALLVHWVGLESAWVALACIPAKVLQGQVWRLLTAGILTDISHPMGLIMTLVGLYFLSPDLERRWGTARFLGYLAACTVLGNALSIGVDRVAPDSFPQLHPPILFGAGAAIVGTAIAWGIYNRDQQILFFMFLPMRGQTLVWITIGGCFLYLLYMGDLTGFGGVAAGLTMVGEPSALRRAYLRVKLALLQSRYDGRGRRPTAADIVRAKGPILRSGRPPLRVVQGGADDKRERPGEKADKPDKRYLN
jgi:membrane associated rhomboid family serine protease